MSKDMKYAVCCKCGKKSSHKILADAENVTCFKCSEAEYADRK